VSPEVQAPPRRPPAVSRANGHPPLPPPRTGGGDGPDGDPPPRRPGLDNAMLGTIFFIGAEIMFFAGLVSAFWVLRLGTAVWPPPLQPRLPVGLTAVNTAVLIASSIAVVAAFRALRRGERRAAARGLGLAAGLGGLFLAIQGYEWARLVHFGLTVSSGAYGGAFYTLIGAHALHVLGALVWLLVSLWMLVTGRLDRPHWAEGQREAGGSRPDTGRRHGDAPRAEAARRLGALHACALYWHFVVALWPVLYVSVYLV
jgi:heme/copper-type cytochrome/quinol oxidase subunit 3